MFKKLREYLFDIEDEVKKDDKEKKQDKNLEEKIIPEEENIVRKLSEAELKQHQQHVEKTQRHDKNAVMFVDDVFDKPKPKNDAYPSTSEKRFKPRPFISPVHGVLDEQEPVPVKEEKVEDEAKVDYAEIRTKAFENVNSVTPTSTPKKEKGQERTPLFETSEIVNLKKRLQIDDEPGRISDENVSLEEAYRNSEEDVEYDIYKIKKKANKKERKLNLLDLLEDE